MFNFFKKKEKAYDDVGMHIILEKGASTMDADPYSKTMNNLKGSGQEDVQPPSA